MQQNAKIPIVVGVTGHRNIVDEDKPEIKEKVKESLQEIKNLCKGKNGDDTPVIMLNAFAQGADMLCAEAAFELGIDVYAVLPCKEEKYKQSFNLHQTELENTGITSGKEFEEALAKDEADKKKLDDYLSRVRMQGGRINYAPDIEKNKAWLKSKVNIDDESYEYRQLGIYMAEHSHILLALWDGKPPKDKFGCGTVEVIKFALEHKFLDKDHLFKPGTINDSAVLWIKSRRRGDGAEADIQTKWLISTLDNASESSEYSTSDNPPAFLREIINKTVRYNSETSKTADGSVKLWQNASEVDEYRKTLDYHCAKSDELACDKNQKWYNRFILYLAIVGAFIALSFLIYDDASLPVMIFPCTLGVGLVILLCCLGGKKGYHGNYIEYRAFAEALRIQFYLSMCLNESVTVTNVCDLYSWTQKVNRVWIDKAIQAIAVISETETLNVAVSDVMEAWIGRTEKPEGQLHYHVRKREVNIKKARLFKNLAKGFQIATVAIYFVIFALEIAACVLKALNADWFWENNVFANISWRSFGAIIIGTVTAASLLASSYWGKLSYDRKADDNIKMCEFYSSAYSRWNEAKNYPDGEIEKFVKEIAREEIVENGIWCSYVRENSLEINI